MRNLTQTVMTQFIKFIFKRDYWGWDRGWTRNIIYEEQELVTAGG